ncbi:branched-chain amino acid transport system permease protein [Anaerospora hongkongensis]|uniref:Branched-chain amino acid transport system permease protein n=1 Tax=Anaerospora hongkongensis TaxID=244830 RepID=A0A4R1Q8E5_9FIRM|nr:branched-chain amino acid ABC transporter permease [Anaerospora hongkongensis]TCL38631.1 branched-chain amino acid transport system permease protein [Anaerospora hongkongensis]
MEKMKKKPHSITAGILLVTVLLPLVITDDYVLRILIMSGIFVMLTLSLNLVTGFTGQFCLGWAAFYGIGAYTSALLTMKAGLSFWLAMPLGGLMAALFGLLLGLPTMRLKEIYLAITTLGFGEIIRLIMLNWTDLTRGSMGLPGIPAPSILSYEISSNQAYYYFILVLVLITVAAIRRLIDSRTGRALIAIREDELAAKSMGIDVTAYKMLAFAVGAFFAGLAGSFYAHYTSFIDPHTFSFTESIAILAMAVLGGLGSINGSILGAVILTVVPELLRGIAEYRLIVFGLIMMAVMLLRPQGIFGKARENSTSRAKARGRGGVRIGSA